MRLSPTAIAGVVSVQSQPFNDPRGSFARLFCRKELESIVGQREIVQINHSRTLAAGTVRGLHFQHPPHTEMKLVRCLAGKVWDVVVDLRAASETFLQWHAEELSPLNGRMLVVPEGCAHGFQTLEGESEMLYLHTAFYSARSDDGIQPADPKLRIPWPLPIHDMSERDRSLPPLSADFKGLIV